MPFNNARNFLAEWYGDTVVSNIEEADFTVGTSAVRIAQQDPAVITRAISNNGTAPIFVSSLAKLAVGQGFMVAVGDTANLSVLEDFDLASCDLFAISASPGNAVHVISTQIVGGS